MPTIAVEAETLDTIFHALQLMANSAQNAQVRLNTQLQEAQNAIAAQASISDQVGSGTDGGDGSAAGLVQAGGEALPDAGG